MRDSSQDELPTHPSASRDRSAASRALDRPGGRGSDSEDREVSLRGSGGPSASGVLTPPSPASERDGLSHRHASRPVHRGALQRAADGLPDVAGEAHADGDHGHGAPHDSADAGQPQRGQDIRRQSALAGEHEEPGGDRGRPAQRPATRGISRRDPTEWVSWKRSKIEPRAEQAKRKWDEAGDEHRDAHTVRRNDGWKATEVREP
jgi:hypothetical protein